VSEKKILGRDAFLARWHNLPKAAREHLHDFPDHDAALREKAEKAEIDAARMRVLADFGASIVEAYFDDGDFGDLDGGWVQDKAVELGLLVHPVVPHSPDDCEGCADEPGSCYVLDAALAQPVPEKEGRKT
jgi:hypothetical protein